MSSESKTFLLELHRMINSDIDVIMRVIFGKDLSLNDLLGGNLSNSGELDRAQFVRQVAHLNSISQFGQAAGYIPWVVVFVDDLLAQHMPDHDQQLACNSHHRHSIRMPGFDYSHTVHISSRLSRACRGNS